MLRKKKPAFIIAFDATTQAMATDKLCAKNGLPGRLIPVPREITAGCGFAWKSAPFHPHRDIVLFGQNCRR